jgi:hypothetical protein
MLAKEPRDRPGMQAVAAVLDMAVREGPFQSRHITAVGPLPLPPQVWAQPGLPLPPSGAPAAALPPVPGFWSAPWATLIPGTSGSGLALDAGPSLLSPRPPSNPALAQTHRFEPRGRQLLLAGWTTLLCLLILGTLLAARRPEPQPVVVPTQKVQPAAKARADKAATRPPAVASAPPVKAASAAPAQHPGQPAERAPTRLAAPATPAAPPVAAPQPEPAADARKPSAAPAPSATDAAPTRLRLHRPAGLDLTTETPAAPNSALSLRPPPWHRSAPSPRAPLAGHLKNHDIPLVR